MTETRTQQACLGCRQKKLRCMPSSEDDDCCRRCNRLSLECVVPAKKQRLSKARLRGRVDQLESSYSQILSLLTKKTDSEHGTSEPQHALNGVDAGIVDPVESAPPAKGRRDVVAVLDLDLEASLATYRRMSAEHFPFVIVPRETSAISLSQKRPMLARAIAIATSWSSPNEQSARRALFLSDLSSRYFVLCERSLDLLQALMVYFGWCHWYATPFSPIAYRLASLAVSMTLELGLNERPSEVTQHQKIVQSSSLAESSSPTSEQHWSHEVGRAYVGAYTLSMYCSLLFRKPSPLTYTPYLHERASSISANPQQPSDAMMIHYLLALRLSDDVNKSFDQGSSETMRGMHNGRIQVLLKTLCRQLNDWKDALPPSTLNQGKMVRQILLARTYIHEVGLYHLLEGQTPSIDRIDTLLECFNTTRDYLAAVLSLSVESMTEWNCMDWRSLNYALMVNSRSATILDSFCYCNESSQRAVWIDSCYDTLSSRVRLLASMAALPEDHFLVRLSADWTNAKSHYHQGVNQALLQTMSTAAGAPVGAQVQDHDFDMDNMYNMSWATFGGVEDWTNVEGY